ncbi:WXG100 family type VII secretion target [Kitasatospora aureofaciens]|uniref:WXG100 family type VII secretion target n=1 Tax=Kitasatospora aureofaciens TaxID=1894 RepID=UPI0036F47B9A
MVDLDFERRMNPWLFDSSGNLTDAAKKQFPDLAAAASGTAAPAYAPSVPSGAPTVTVSVEALTRAANNVDTLKTKFAQACKQPSGHVSAVDNLPSGWALRTAVAAANSVWTDQVKALEGAIGQLAEALRTNAGNYARAEHANAQNFGMS